MSHENQGSASDDLNQTVRSAAEGLKETGAQAMAGAKSVMGGAMADLKAGASAKADEMRGTIAEEGQRMASSLRDAAGQGSGGVQARVLETVASGVEAVSGQIAARDVSGLMNDVTAFARRNPAVFVAGAAVAGLVLARLAAQAGRSQQGGGQQDFSHRNTQAGDMGAGFAAGGMADDLGTEFGSGQGQSMGSGQSKGSGPSMGGNL